MNKFHRILLFLVLIKVSPCSAQTIPVGMPGIDDAFRILQLQGKLDIKYSLSSRPFFTDKSITTDSINHLIDQSTSIETIRKHFAGKYGVVEILPLTFSSQFNSHHPYGWNHAGMIQAKGIQTFVSTGVYASVGPLSIQLKPEIVYAQNPEFEHSTEYGAVSKGAYSHLFPGQSSVRLNIRAVSVGLSSENMWWGPGIYNSLLMSNNAPGFPHLIFNTTRPIKTPIGNFEWQIIAGKLTEDTSLYLENKNLATNYYNPAEYSGDGYSGPYDPKQKWRYLNGLSISYNPKWIKGLFIGIHRVGYTYNDKLQKSGGGYDFLHKYFPTIFGAFRQNYAYGNDSVNNDIGYKQTASFSIRFVFPKSSSEIYIEYGKNDNPYNLRDLATDPEHGAAFTVGFKKLVQLEKEKWLDINVEITQLAQTPDYLVRNTGNWYLYQGGYTNQNRIIGAGYGMGSNMQTIHVIHMNGFNKLGFILQRIQHDPTNTNRALPLATLGLRDTKWTDISLGVIVQKKINRFLLNLQVQGISSNNYIWQNNNNVFNLYAFGNIVYQW